MEPPAPPGPRAAIFGAWRRWLLVGAGALALIAIVLVAGGGRSRAPRPEETASAVVTVAEAALRSEPSLKGSPAQTLKRGDEVEIVADRGIWLEVHSPGGARGFVRAGEIERESEREARQERAKKILAFPPVYGVVGQDTAVLLAPYPLAPRAGVQPKGTVIPIHAVDHAYFAYRDRANGVAFVASADVDLVPPDPKSPEIGRDASGGLRRLATLEVPTPVPTPFDLQSPPPAPPAADGVPPSPPLGAPAPAEGATPEPAVLVSKVDPEYPEIAVRAQVEGTVVLEIEIDDTGRVVDARVTRGLPFGLSQAAEEAVRQWRYRPARGPGGPIPSRKTVRILFTLRGGG